MLHRCSRSRRRNRSRTAFGTIDEGVFPWTLIANDLSSADVSSSQSPQPASAPLRSPPAAAAQLHRRRPRRPARRPPPQPPLPPLKRPPLPPPKRPPLPPLKRPPLPPPRRATAAAAGEPTARAHSQSSTLLGTRRQNGGVLAWPGRRRWRDDAGDAQDLRRRKGDRTVRSETYDWDVFYQKLPTSIVANTPPNLAIMHSWAIQQFAAQGMLQPADDIFFSTGLVPKDDFNPSLIEAITVDGKTQAVPFDNHGWINWVNTKVIKDAGLDPDKAAQEWHRIHRVGAKDRGRRGRQAPERGRLQPRQGQDLGDPQLLAALHAALDDLAVRRRHLRRGKKSLLNDPKTIAAVQYWYDLIYKYHVVPPAVPGVPCTVDLFKTNSIALMWDGTWNLNFFKDNPDAQAVMEPMYLNSLAPDGKQAVRFDSHMLVIPTGVEGEALEDAKDLIKWLSDNGETWATSGQVPARLSVQQKPVVQEIPSVQGRRRGVQGDRPAWPDAPDDQRDRGGLRGGLQRRAGGHHASGAGA